LHIHARTFEEHEFAIGLGGVGFFAVGQELSFADDLDLMFGDIGIDRTALLLHLIGIRLRIVTRGDGQKTCREEEGME